MNNANFCNPFDNIPQILRVKASFLYHVCFALYTVSWFHCFNGQRVVLDNCVSNDVEVLSGVLQGSILGPLLFVLFINDIYDNINENSRISLYADDTKLWRRINSALDCDILQKDIDTLYKWTMTNSSSSTKGIAMKTSKIKIYPLLT